jgi:pimeloyl-ACP methyl ester carboxylesterase
LHVAKRASVILESRFYRVRGLKVHVREARGTLWPDAPTVVLVHGLMVSSRYMVPFAETLAPFCRVLAPDLPGSGLSDKPPRVLDTAGLVGALVETLEAAGVRRASFYANSYGCQVVARLAAREPAVVERLVLDGPTVDRRARTLVRQLLRGARDLAYENPALLPRIARDYFRFGVIRGFHTFAEMLRAPIEADLPQVRAPALIVVGARDPIVPRSWAEELVRASPDARLVELPGCPHAANFSAPLELARVVLPFLGVRPEPGALQTAA